MTDHPPYPYSDGQRAILGPDVHASADGQTITWQGATYSRHRGETHCLCGGIGVVHNLGGAAGDTGPSVEECRDNDRAWPLQKHGE